MQGLHHGVIVRTVDRNAFVLDALLTALLVKRLSNQRRRVVRAYHGGMQPVRWGIETGLKALSEVVMEGFVAYLYEMVFNLHSEVRQVL